MHDSIHWVNLEVEGNAWPAAFSDQGLRILHFPGRLTLQSHHLQSSSPSKQIQAWQESLHQWIKDYLSGKRPSLRRCPPLDLDQGTEFQRAIWEVLRGIPYGRTMSYGEVAAAAGRPKALRAAGGACGANPIPLIIPCHRVLAAQRKLGGFSGGLPWKELLLELEGIRLGTGG